MKGNSEPESLNEFLKSPKPAILRNGNEVHSVVQNPTNCALDFTVAIVMTGPDHSRIGLPIDDDLRSPDVEIVSAGVLEPTTVKALKFVMSRKYNQLGSTPWLFILELRANGQRVWHRSYLQRNIPFADNPIVVEQLRAIDELKHAESRR